jgi:protein phosphatase
LTLAYVVWPQLYLVHAGDSRCYLYRNGRLRRLTTDHTLADKLVEAGVLDPCRAAQSPWRNVLWKAIGVDGIDIEPDIYQLHLMVDDLLVLCTAGLTRCLEDKRIAGVLEEGGEPRHICQCLLETAKGNGAADNMTVVVARLQGDEPQEPSVTHPAAAVPGAVAL